LYIFLQKKYLELYFAEAVNNAKEAVINFERAKANCLKENKASRSIFGFGKMYENIYKNAAKKSNYNIRHILSRMYP